VSSESKWLPVVRISKNVPLLAASAPHDTMPVNASPWRIAMPPRPLAKLRKVCLALPEAHEVEAWGEPTFRVRNKLFAMYANADNHHGNGRHAVWIKAQKADQLQLIKAAPECYFVPPYVGKGGWIGVWLDSQTNWDAVREFLEDGYRMTAPARLIGQLDKTV
jgi:hypothetical protein